MGRMQIYKREFWVDQKPNYSFIYSRERWYNNVIITLIQLIHTTLILRCKLALIFTILALLTTDSGLQSLFGFWLTFFSDYLVFFSGRMSPSLVHLMLLQYGAC